MRIRREEETNRLHALIATYRAAGMCMACRTALAIETIEHEKGRAPAMSVMGCPTPDECEAAKVACWKGN